MPRLKLRYREGDVFEVPVPPGPQRAFGLVVRSTVGPGFLGYFFFAPEVPDPQALRPQDAVLVARASDLALMGNTEERRGKGDPRWPIIGRLEGFSRAGWPVPYFFRSGYGIVASLIVEYDHDAEDEIRTFRAADGDEARYFADGLDGAISVEKQLAKLLHGGLAAATPPPAAA